MHKNEAISNVASKAMEQIFDIAQFAISRITDGAVGDIEPMLQTSFTEVAKRAAALDALAKNDAQEIVPSMAPLEKQIRGRKTRAPVTPTQEILEPIPTSENDFVEQSDAVEVEPEAVEDTTPTQPFSEVQSQDEVDDNPDFPNHPDDWFSQDVERARNACRSLLAKVVSKNGTEAARKSIMDTVGKPRVTDFDAEDCTKFYRAFRNNV